MDATERGRDMSRDTFLAAARLAADYGEYVTIGGGEPTLHPLLFDFLGIGMSLLNTGDSGSICVITNGKLEEPALRLAHMARQEFIQAELSQDRYHERVNPRVVAAFTSTAPGPLGIRTVTRILNVGRARRNQINTENETCPCDELFVVPSGKLYACGHRRRQHGTVFDPEIPEQYESGECPHRRVRRRA
jgi:sulfatase maturation enzyme AslB (radical SAM superfamily)